MMWRAFELAFRRLLAQALATAICWGMDDVVFGHLSLSMAAWYIVPIAPSRGRSLEFPFEREGLRLRM